MLLVGSCGEICLPFVQIIEESLDGSFVVGGDKDAFGGDDLGLLAFLFDVLVLGVIKPPESFFVFFYLGDKGFDRNDDD